MLPKLSSLLSQLYDLAKQMFQDTNVQITCHGQRHLGAAMGHGYLPKNMCPRFREYLMKYLLCLLLLRLILIVLIVHLFMVWYKWNYVMRTIESVGSLFQPLEEVIHQHFIPSLTGRDPCCTLERDLLSLPCDLEV